MEARQADILFILSIPVNSLRGFVSSCPSWFRRSEGEYHARASEPVQRAPELYVRPRPHRALLLAARAGEARRRADLPAAGEPPDRAGIGAARLRRPADSRARHPRAGQLAAQRRADG